MIDKIIFKYNRLITNNFARGLLERAYFRLIELKKLIIYGTSDIFEEVILETTTLCNRSCSYCPVSIKRRETYFMESSLHNKIIEELSAMGFKGSLLYQFFSEPLMDKKLEKHLNYARKKLNGSSIEIYSNGDLLTKKRLNSLIKAGASIIKVTLHENKNTKAFLGTYSKLSSFEKSKIAIRELNDSMLLSTRGGIASVKNKEIKKKCGYPSNSLTIDAYGNVVLCCEDYLSSVKFGNAAKNTITEIWNNHEFRKIREDTLKGRFSLAICRNCTLKQ